MHDLVKYRYSDRGRKSERGKLLVAIPAKGRGGVPPKEPAAESP